MYCRQHNIPCCFTQHRLCVFTRVCYFSEIKVTEFCCCNWRTCFICELFLAFGRAGWIAYWSFLFSKKLIGIKGKLQCGFIKMLAIKTRNISHVFLSFKSNWAKLLSVYRRYILLIINGAMITFFADFTQSINNQKIFIYGRNCLWNIWSKLSPGPSRNIVLTMNVLLLSIFQPAFITLRQLLYLKYSRIVLQLISLIRHESSF